ncbi:MAG TPA: TonB-dependent receptor [Opitutaceae bacterium]|nr:TonB-dependent receptor [Opitutaceae bacterium]
MLAAFATGALAQTAPTYATTASSADSDEAVVLSPFEVHAGNDHGYTAVDTLAGGRTNAPLAETPAAISELTRQFLDDISATNLREISEWGVNATANYGAGTSNPLDYTVNLRSLSGGFPSRNYFVWYINSDSYATERLEYARGPNGVLFGDGNVGGIVTVFTKRARFDRPLTTVSLRTDNYGSHRFTADYNQPLNDKVALRLNLLSEDYQNWRDDNPFKNEGAHLAGTIRLTPNTQFRFEGEYGRSVRHLYYVNYSENASYWDGVTNYDGKTAPNTKGTGVGKVASTTYNLYIPSMPQAGFADWSNMYRTLGTGFAVEPNQRTDIANFPVLPNREINIQPPDSVQILKFYTYSFYLDQHVGGNLDVELAFNHLRNDAPMYNMSGFLNSYTIDVNKVLPNGLPNPKYGVPYAENQFTDAPRAGNTVDDFRAMATDSFSNRWIDERVSLIGGSRLDRYNAISRTLYRTNGTNPNFTNAANIVRARFYYDEPAHYSAQGILAALDRIPGETFGFLPSSVANERKWIDYGQILSTTKLFKGKLNIMLGARIDKFHDEQRNTSGIPVNPVTGLPQLGAVIFTPASPYKPVAVVGAKTNVNVKPVSKNAGGVYSLLPWLGVYANYSETFAPPSSGSNLIDGTAPGISRSKGQDYGFKLNLLHDKLVGTIDYYTTQQENSLAYSNTNATQINRIWTNLGRPELAHVDYRDTQDFKGKGWEFDFTANPTPNFRAMFNFALPQTSIINVLPGLQKYVADNLATWQAGANDPSNPTAAQIQTDINAIKSTLAGLTPGTPLNNTYKYLGNIYGTYTIPSGMLRNVSVGLGANLRGPSKLTSVAGSPYQYLYSNSYYILSGHIAWDHEFKKFRMHTQLNVSNILNNHDLIWISYADYRVGGLSTNPATRLPNQFRYIDPIRFTLSTSFTF